MSRLCFALYFVALSVCATIAFASHPSYPTQSAAFATYLDSPVPRGAFLAKPVPQHAVPQSSQVALAN